MNSVCSSTSSAGAAAAGAAAGGGRHRHGHGRGGNDAELLLDALVQVAQLEDRHLLDQVERLIDAVAVFLGCLCCWHLILLSKR